MKKLNIFLCILVLSSSTFGQQPGNTPSMTKTYYLQKSKNQKKAGWIILGSGSALLLTSFLIPKGEPSSYNAATNVGNLFSFYGPSETVYKNNGIKRIVGITGALSMLVSVRFFIVSGKNNRRAIRMAFKNEMVPQIRKLDFSYNTVPSLSLKINLKESKN